MYIGLDIGTSSVKAVLFDADQALVAQASVPLSVSRPHPGWSEQDPEDWWQAVRSAIGEIARTHALAGLRGIGLSGQQHGAVCLDAEDRVLRPAILWNDGRAFAHCAELVDLLPEGPELAGSVPMAGFTAPKLLWMAQHEPDLREKVAKVLLPKDYVRFRLTGEYASDMSDASGTYWLDIAKRDWSDELLSIAGLSRAEMPRLVEGSEDSGHLRAALAVEWGIDGPVAVAGGGGDNAAAACGVGVVGDGAAFVSIGTSGVLFASNDRYRPNTGLAMHAFCHALPQTWHQMGVVLSAADSLEWLSRITGRPTPEMVAEIGEVSAPSQVQFLPYLSGERTPVNDADARGVFAGLAQAHGVADLTQAVLEGVAYAFGDCQSALMGAGTEYDSALAVGGGAQSDLWLTIIASVLDRPLEVPADAAVGAALGAARLAICAAEGADPAQICTKTAIAKVIEPDAALVPQYAEAQARYRRLYPAFREASS